jgi:hypothetical protein
VTENKEARAILAKGWDEAGVGGDFVRWLRDGTLIPDRQTRGALNAIDQIVRALDLADISKLEDDVQAYHGNEASGRAEIARRKSAAYDQIVNLVRSLGR